MHKHAANITTGADTVIFTQWTCVCVAGVERWPGKPGGPVTSLTTATKFYDVLSGWFHITANYPGLQSHSTIKLPPNPLFIAYYLCQNNIKVILPLAERDCSKLF